LSELKLGFIGAGNMASAILGGILRQGLLPSRQISMADPMADKLGNLKESGVHVTNDNRSVALYADLLILAIKPQMFDAVLPQLADCVSGKCVVSIAPGISVGYLQKRLHGAFVVRVMPNTPLLVGMGATAVAEAGCVPAEMFQTVIDIFSAAGEVAVIPESQMDAIVAVSASSPAFFFRMADAMVTEAQRQGIDPALALRMAARTMEGSANMLLQSGKTAKELTTQVCSPGGTTLAALSAFDDMGFEAMISEAMIRCTKRSRELGR
jgi:pyrroline-5-carboxylate reductase